MQMAIRTVVTVVIIVRANTTDTLEAIMTVLPPAPSPPPSPIEDGLGLLDGAREEGDTSDDLAAVIVLDSIGTGEPA